MGKILVIGDLHGLNTWEAYKSYVLEEDNKIVFLGDYVDSFTISDKDIINNLRELIEFKRSNMDKVVLLLGNHDIQYIYNNNRCSGYRASYATIIGNLFKHNLELFKICHEEGEYLFSHAGFIKEWEEHVYNKIDKSVFNMTSYDSYNDLLNTRYKDLLFIVSYFRRGTSSFGGPLWADKAETLRSGNLINRVQVVGHTPVTTIEKHDFIFYCDNLEYGDKKILIINTDKDNDTII